ncbi:MAG TPA: MarR family transcriptional regulator [Candidatus Acidoferrales bacterium]|nr:MarR family transcriptional regulator [Candidatus Acidoferrales bacterium]
MNEAAFEALSALLGAGARISRAADAKIGGYHGLSLTELLLLRAIGERPDGRLRPADLARELHLSASGVTRALLPLEKRGIVKRLADPADGRASFATLTPAGEALVADASRTAGELAERLMRRLSLGQTRQLIRLLEEIAA